MSLSTSHTFTTTGRCPVDGSLDIYDVTVSTNGMVAVEDLLKVVADITSAPIFQEKFTHLLSKKFNAAVKTTGVHSGVKTVCEATP